MKQLMIIVIMSSFFSYIQAQKSNSENLYLEALILHLKNSANANIDTIIVQKEDFLPDEYSNVINKHKIKFLSEKEIDSYYGNTIALRKIFPIEVENDLLVIRIAYFGYSTKDKLWVFSGGSYYRFKYNCDNKKFIFFKKEEYGF